MRMQAVRTFTASIASCMAPALQGSRAVVALSFGALQSS